ncbi:putative endonuclease V [Leptomonas seymouri]|uniref:Putative endonuclease V n=1 Tax=Leptomonas seymouri TaxID=5684 RepID=A0A0N1ILN9_LEPSE|nr:putative endonuclease V [Leptomonas seymouri]|eukprot:KPI88595.1 putative endonuclease V [Leptomonas seymouri]
MSHAAAVHADGGVHAADTRVVDSLLEEKKAAWAQEQCRLAQCAVVPRSELYWCTDTPLHLAGGVDEVYVHKRFSLTGLEAALASLHDPTAAARDREELGSSCPPGWSALLRQLQWDIAQQARYCEERQRQQQQQSAIGGDADSALESLSPASLAGALPELKYIGGVDISFVPGTDDGIACIAILRYPSLEVVKTYMHRCTLREPYISTYLAFREIQPVCELFDEVRVELEATHTMPQLLVVDGNGVHHPRRCGLATHLGVELDIPTIGCSKNILQMDGITRESVEAAFLKNVAVAAATPSPPTSKLQLVLPLVGASTPVQLYGYAVHSPLSKGKKSIFVSPGHGVGFAVATALIVTMLRYRIPEPIRAADLGSRAFIRDSLAPAAAADTTGA